MTKIQDAKGLGVTEPQVAAPPRRPCGRPARRGRPAAGGSPSTAVSGLGLGLVMLWISILVLLPLVAVVVQRRSAAAGGVLRHDHQPAVAAAIRLTVLTAAVRHGREHRDGHAGRLGAGRRPVLGPSLLSLVIDVPFALPTIVAGLVLLALYGPRARSASTWLRPGWSIFVALAFVTLPFVVRTVQPVLEEMERDVEEAAASLGASRFTTFRRIDAARPRPGDRRRCGAVLRPRQSASTASVVLISGNLAAATEVARSGCSARSRTTTWPRRRRWRRSCWSSPSR